VMRGLCEACGIMVIFLLAQSLPARACHYGCPGASSAAYS